MIKKWLDRRLLNRQKMKHCYFKYQVGDSPSFIKGELINVSADGLCFLRKGVINNMDIINLIFYFKLVEVDIRSEVIRITGKEVAVKFLESPGKIESFIDIFNSEFEYLASSESSV